MLVIEDHVDHCRLEDSLIAQHRVLDLYLAQQLVGDITARTEDCRRTAVPVTSQHGERKGIVVLILADVLFEEFDVDGGGLDLLLGDVVDELLQPEHVFRTVAIHKLLQRGIVLGPSLFVHPCKRLGQDIVCPHRHMTGLQDERQSVVALAHHLCHLALTETEHDIIEQDGQGYDGHRRCCLPYPRGDTCILTVGIEPFVLNGLQTVAGAQIGIYAVDLIQQDVVLRHELVFAIRQIDRLDGQVVGMVFPHQPLERHGVPDDDSLVVGTHFLDGLLHVVVGNDLLGPVIIINKVVAEAAFVYDDRIARQTLAR